MRPLDGPNVASVGRVGEGEVGGFDKALGALEFGGFALDGEPALGGEPEARDEFPGLVERNGEVEVSTAEEFVGVAGREFEPDASSADSGLASVSEGEVADAEAVVIVAAGDADVGVAVGGVLPEFKGDSDHVVPPGEERVEDSSVAGEEREFDEPFASALNGFSIEVAQPPGFGVFVDGEVVAHFVGDGEVPLGLSALGENRAERDGPKEGEGGRPVVAEGEGVGRGGRLGPAVERKKGDRRHGYDSDHVGEDTAWEDAEDSHKRPNAHMYEKYDMWLKAVYLR